MTIITGSTLKIQQGSVILQYLAAAACLINVATSGMHYGWPSPSLPKLSNTTNSTIIVNNEEGSWIAVMPLLGAFLGSSLIVVMVDILGRKRMIIMSSIPYFLTWIMIAYANSIYIIYVARFIAGVIDGWIFTSVPMYIGEISDPKIRGLLGSAVSTTWIFGILLINIIGSYMSVTMTALVSSALPVIAMIIFAFMPESPYYLIMRNQYETAKKSLQKFRGLDDVENELTRIAAAVKQQLQNNGKFLDLFTKQSNRRAVWIIMILRGAQQLSGTTAVTFYAQDIFNKAGEYVSAKILSIIYFSVQLFLACFCCSIVDRAGRRPLLIISITGSAVFLFIEGMYFYLSPIYLSSSNNSSLITLIPVIALIGNVFTFSLGMQTIPILMLSELFPTNVKAFALCLADIYFSIIATIVSKFFQFSFDNIGIYVPFFCFSACCLIGLILIILFVPETKGKTLEDIQVNLK